MTTITSMFQSKANQNAEQNVAANAKKETDANESANANESVELKQVSFQESRDDPSLFERFFCTPSNVLSDAIAEAASIADDIQTVITAELDEEKELIQLREERELRELREESEDKEVQGVKEVEVKGSHTDLAKEIKKLGKLERILERAEKQIMKSEKQIYLTEQKQMKTRMKIKALSHKFELDE
mmetsp:Transcript_12826/g.19342  ORF Transcript_12826/g.19342 Transcript_12826/m.19342 type:complete len:186 (-) Transcript_12826:170-727(-)|eukprot:scaffold10642_cov155-Skeletonema_dohrnii-CCMP3373.AAC.10